jgi:FkbM family methyltransferase
MKIMRRIKSYWMVLGKQKRPYKFIIARILMKLGLSCFLIIYKDGYKIRFFPTALSAALWINSCERLNDEVFFKKYLKAGDNVIDVGSNIGTLTLTAASLVGEKGRVVSIEPHPRTFKFLSKNIGLNRLKNIKSLNIAVGEKGGHVNFSSIKSDDLNRVLQSSGGLKVPILRLDEVVDRELKIALLKIDVEGYEKFVISGAEKILKNSDCIWFESYEEHFNRFGYSTVDIIRLIKKNNFSVWKISNGVLKILDDNYKSLACENLIAIKNLDDFISRTAFQVKNN